MDNSGFRDPGADFVNPNSLKFEANSKSQIDFIFDRIIDFGLFLTLLGCPNGSPWSPKIDPKTMVAHFVGEIH